MEFYRGDNFQKHGRVSMSGSVLEFSNETGHFFGTKKKTIHPSVYNLWHNLILPFLHLVTVISAFLFA